LNKDYITTGVRAIEWGLNNKDAALSFLQKTENVVIQKTGLWLHKCGYLGASPDGLIGENDVVEVKCPYKFRNSLLSEEISKDKTYLIYKEQTSSTTLLYQKTKIHFCSLDTKRINHSSYI